MVDCIRELVTFIWDTWVENKFHAIADQPGYMAMGKFGRIAFRFTWNGLNTQLVNLSGGSRREHNLILQFCKESIPERIIFKHIQNTRDTDHSAAGIGLFERSIIKVTMQLIFKKVRHLIL